MSSCPHSNPPAYDCCYCRHFNPSEADKQKIAFGYQLKNRSLKNPLPAYAQGYIYVSEQIHGAYCDYRDEGPGFAIFPTLSTLEKYIKALEDLRMNPPGDGITEESVNSKISFLKTTNESFTLLKNKNDNVLDIPESFTESLPLPIDPRTLWMFERGQYELVINSWKSSTENYDFIEKAKRQLKAAEWLYKLQDIKKYKSWNDLESLQPTFLAQK